MVDQVTTPSRTTGSREAEAIALMKSEPGHSLTRAVSPRMAVRRELTFSPPRSREAVNVEAPRTPTDLMAFLLECIPEVLEPVCCAVEKPVFDAIVRRIDQVGPGRAYPNERFCGDADDGLGDGRVLKALLEAVVGARFAALHPRVIP